MSECRVVDLKELGVSKEVFDKIYSMGEQDGREDVIDEIIKDYCIKDNFGYEYVIIDKATLEQLKENNAKNKEAN